MIRNLPDQWCASLRLSFEQRGNGRTVLATREHKGPLLVQRPLYPEGQEICHAVVLHPPSGIAGGDILDISVKVNQDARAVISTPGATRWYKSNGRPACQMVHLRVAEGGKLDWLPLENIFFEETDAFSSTQVELESGAAAIGWDVFQLGQVNKANYWDAGLVRTRTSLKVDGKLLWIDQGQIQAQDAIRPSVSGMFGFPVHGVLWCFGPTLKIAHHETLAQFLPWANELRSALTAIPFDECQTLYLVRGLGIHMEEVRTVMTDAWAFLRQHVLGAPAIPLRLWAT